MSELVVIPAEELRELLEEAVRAALGEAQERAPPAEPAPKRFITLEEALAYLQCSRSTLYRARKEGLGSIKIRGRVYIELDELERWIAEHGS